MDKIRIRASRRAWEMRAWSRGGARRYERVVAYELRRNGTEEYTQIWEIDPSFVGAWTQMERAA